jgi:hypothetical protein
MEALISVGALTRHCRNADPTVGGPRAGDGRLHDLRTHACPKLTRWSAVVLNKTDTCGEATCRIFLAASRRPTASQGAHLRDEPLAWKACSGTATESRNRRPDSNSSQAGIAERSRNRRL